MNRLLMLFYVGFFAMSVQIGLAEDAGSDHSEHHPEKESGDSMPMRGDRMMDMKNMTPEQCEKMMHQHHEGIKMDKKMMGEMNHCKMMREHMHGANMPERPR